ncbi:hypothetical protein ACS0TY_015877 [Phlomoides rotata]
MYRFSGEESRMYRFGGEESKIMASEKSVMAVIRAARPQFERPSDKVAFAVHATFIAAGYVLHATAPRAFRNDVLTISTLDEVGIDGWNSIPDSYAFLYSNPEERSVKVLVKALVMDCLLIVDVLKEFASEPLHLELDTLEYIEHGGTNYASHYRDFGKLVEEVNKEILCKLNDAPAATKLNDARAATKLNDARAATKSSNRPSNSKTRVREEDRDRPRMEIGEVPPYPGSGMGFDYPDGRIGVSPYSGDQDLPIPGSGGSDLFPGPGAGMYPSRGGFGSGGPGGMLIGPNDPMFIGGRTRQPGRPGRPSGVPPGARFDPFGPPDVPGFEPGRFSRGPPPRGGGMHPDMQHFHNGSDFI